MSFNRKQRRKFNKLPQDQQEEYLQHLMVQKMSPILSQNISKSIILGMELLWQQLYTDSVAKYDAYIAEGDKDSAEAVVDELLSLIRTQYLKIQTNQTKSGEAT